jgi:hypothetical protein
MRISIVCLLFVIGVAGTVKAQEAQTEPYSINLVQSALKLHAQGAYVSIVEKRLPRLGDQVSIALIKIYSADEMSKPETIRSFLPIIQDAFSTPQAIAQEVDRKPGVTFILLKYLQGSVTDVQTQRSIEDTIKFVRGKTGL